MKLQVGDKVKFLNQIGGGVVSKIVSSQVVNVTDESGFDIPTLIKDLVKVEPMTGAGKLFEQEINVVCPEKVENIDNQEYNDEDAVSPLRRIPDNRNIEAGIYLAFVPHEQRWLITGNLDVYILNRTPQTFLLSVSLKSDKDFQNIDYEAIDPESKFFLETIDREQVNNWLHGVVQGIVIGNIGKKILAPISEEFKIKASKFFKEDTYVETACLGEKALLACISKLSDIKTFSEIDEKQIITDKEVQTSDKTKNKKKTILLNSDNILEQYFIEPNIAEVDLHIEALVENPEFLQDYEKFELQMRHFHKCLNDAIVNHVQKVIFIHGVGNGILKNEILKELKQYKGLHYFDASMAKYGVGATEILFGNNVYKEF